MKKELTKFICLKNILTWAVISLLACFALWKFIENLVADIKTGSNFFIPGILVLFAVIAAVLIFAVTRVKKYMRLLHDLKE